MAASRRATALALSAILFPAAGRAQDAPAGGLPFLRLDVGMLSPNSPINVVPAFGLTVGWSPAGSNRLLVRYLQQTANNGAPYLYGHGRSFVLAEWERSFGSEVVLRNQVATRLGLGFLAAYGWPVSPVLGGGLVFRYPLGAQAGLGAGVEDNVAVLPRGDAPGSGGWQHNFGALAFVEWRPGGTAVRRQPSAAPAAPVALPAAAAPGTVCSRLAAAPGQLVRVSTYMIDSAGRPVSRGGSEVGPLVRCGGGTVVVGPTLGQDAPELTIFEPSITRAWVRGHRGLMGTLLGVGSGLTVGYMIGSAHSYLCAGVPCAKHQLSSTAIGAAAGGVVGWVFGRATPRWVPRYP